MDRLFFVAVNNGNIPQSGNILSIALHIRSYKPLDILRLLYQIEKFIFYLYIIFIYFFVTFACWINITNH